MTIAQAKNSNDPAEQRAIHLAGCPNVVCRPWNVNARTTAAVIAGLYQGIWSKDKTPLEALCEAPVTILRHPERINDRQDVDVAVGPTGSRDGRIWAPTRLWAAFALFGVGV